MNHSSYWTSPWAVGSTGLAGGGKVMRADDGLPVARRPALLGSFVLRAVVHHYISSSASL